jgi:leader peptidase (prepilin peptidase) / N-methyltransferase
MPTLLYIAWFFLFGCIIGSFLNVVVRRMHTGRSLGGRSHCASCGHPLRTWHLIPVISYLMLHARCAFCSARISAGYALVEILTGCLFAVSAAFVKDPLALACYLGLMAALVVILAYDLRHTIIPDEWVAIASLFAALIALAGLRQGGGIDDILVRLVAAAIGALFFGGLWYLSEGRWVGLGDAKLAIPLGILVSWPQVISALVLSFWLGAALSVSILGAQRLLKRGQGRLRFASSSLTMKSEIPFAPFLIAGFLLTHFLAFDAFAIPYDLFL